MKSQLRRLLHDLPRATYLLSLAQALNLTCAVISVTIAALVGSHLAETPALGTVPYGAQFASVMLCTFPVSMLMRRHGRRVIFSFGAVMLIIAGIVGYMAVVRSSFAWLIASHVALGIYIACANFYRFAAVDNVELAAKPRAISLVVAGGVLAAVAGPAIANSLRVVPGFADFSLCYAAFCLLGVATLLLMAVWRPQEASSVAQPLVNTPARRAPLGIRRSILVAIFCSASGYFLMNLLMVQASLVMKDICSFSATSFAIEVHVLSMFAPSFLTGSIIARIGLQRTLIAGFLLISAAMVFGTLDVRYEFIFVALILLGLGWNLTYVGGGALLAQSVEERDRHRWQGINDTVIAACATLGAFLPAPMLTGLGWNWSNMLLAPICLLGIILCAKVLPRRESALAQPVMGASVK
jgi:predicted MFS family arabinose efflux permease